MDFLENIITTYGAHLSVAALIIFLLTFIDGMVLVGLLINGWLAFSVCLFSYANGYISLPMMIMASFLGVFIAEQISFYIGQRSGGKIIDISTRAVARLESFKRGRVGRFLPFGISAERFESSLSRTPDHIRRWGGVALIVGRWTPVASMVPALCATLGMRYGRFVRFSAVACALWVVLWCLIIHLGVSGYITLTR